MLVNGEKKSTPQGQSLASFLEKEGYSVSRVAVMRNDEIIKKDRYKETILTEADTLEIVSFVGGG